MAEPIEWLPDGTPASARFGDRYHSRANHGLDQARGVFLAGCDLPHAWAGQAQWRILETGFGLGLNFLAAWAAWRADPQRPRLLHFVSCEAWPVAAVDLLHAAPPAPEITPLAAELAGQFDGLLPGLHRLAFEQGRVLLTLFIGDAQAALRKERPQADSVFLDGFDPRRNPAMWSEPLLKAVARCCHRGTQLATWSTARAVRETLAQCGFAVRKVPGVPPKRENLRAVYDPPWQPHPVRAAVPPVALAGAHTARHGIVIGGGLAGAAVAASLARRGWRVTVFDRAPEPASAASGVPAAIFGPHASPDDSVLSRLSRAGVSATLRALETLAGDLRGSAWDATGVLEHTAGQREPRLAHTDDAGLAWTAPADAAQRGACHLAPDAPALWHARGGWLRPEVLVRRLLAQPGIAWRPGTGIGHLAHTPGAPQPWQVRASDAPATLLASADAVVVCAANASNALLPYPLPLQAVRGTVSWGTRGDAPADTPWPASPVKGHGTCIPEVTLHGTSAWVIGATFERDRDTLPPSAAELAAAHRANHEKLGALLPKLAHALAPHCTGAGARAWSGVRATTPDHLPLVGPVGCAQGLWVCTGLGARGATLALLCAELLAARLLGEPLPLEAALARALGTERLARRAAQSPARSSSPHTP